MRRAAIASALAAFALACGPGPEPQPVRAEAAPAAACPTKIGARDEDPARVKTWLGKSVARICVVGAAESKADVERTIQTKRGETLDATRVRADLEAIMRLGSIEDVSVLAEGEGNGVVVLYDVRERPRITEVKFTGANLFSSQGLAEKVPLANKRPFVAAEARQLATALEEEYHHRGYGGAKVSYATEPAGPGLVKLRFDVVEGAEWKLATVAFQGVSKALEADLRAAIKLPEGEAYEADKVERAGLLAAAFYYDHGMLKVHIDEPRVETAADGKVTVTMKVVEGDVYKVGKIAFAKAADKMDKQLLPKIKTRSKETFDRSRVAKDIQTLRDYFEGIGQKVDIVPITHLDDKKKTVDLTFEVEPQ